MRKKLQIIITFILIFTLQACSGNRLSEKTKASGGRSTAPVATTVPPATPVIPTLSPTMEPALSKDKDPNPSSATNTLTPAVEPTQAAEPVLTPAAAPGPTAAESVASPTVKPSEAPVKPSNSPSEPMEPSKIFHMEDIVYPYEAYTYEKMMEDSKLLQEKHPDLISLGSIGQSVEGRDLLLLKLGRGEEKLLLCGTHHAREYIGSTLLMKMTEVYADSYSANMKIDHYNVKELLGKVTFYIVPMVNPDGVNLVNNGINTVKDPEQVKKLKMMQETYREWKSNINGIDLNRQYPAFWEESITSASVPASEHYKGTKAASEPEVQAMMKLCEEENFQLAVSFHTKGEVVYWADSKTVDEIPEAKGIAQRYAKITGYDLMPVSQNPAVFGAGLENWFRLEFRRPGFCVELTPSDGLRTPHPDDQFDELVWNPAKTSGLFFAEEALKMKGIY